MLYFWQLNDPTNYFFYSESVFVCFSLLKYRLWFQFFCEFKKGLCMICVGKCCVAAYVCVCVCAGAILYLSSVTSVCCHLPSPAVAFQTNVYMNLPYTLINTLHLNTHAHKHTHLMFLYSNAVTAYHTLSHTHTHIRTAGPANALMHLSLHMFISPP